MKILLKRFLIILISLLVFLSLIVYFAFYSTLFLQKGDLVKEVTSPNNTYTAKVYRFGNEGGLRVDVNVGFFGDKLIYWSWKEANTDVEWTDDIHLKINGRLLDVRTDKFDKRTMD
ncbi:DUF5412 family protein [Brevibacillus halotolerans]|uniref:DUF5412 family protein n=1 Tax=Brevibacillus halotolerans TaxID=1507437 RepID=UPI0015EF6F19|nr:DUF5412 family protein [Brevibacillus halotolerans]MBA4534439.1 hypothetical protein [Brevibacillus halotolerans]